MHYARSENGIVAEVLRVDPFSICYPERAAMFRPCDEVVQIGWVDDGKTFRAPPAPAPVVPAVVSARQAKRALLEAGLLDDVQMAIDNIPDDLERRRVQIDWDESTEFRRDWPALALLATVMKLDEGTLDALFIEAATL